LLDTHTIHFIIPSFKGERTIRKCLDSIIGQDYPKSLIKVSVVENGPQTTIKSLIEQDENSTYFYNPIQGRSQARNYLLDKVDSDFIAYVDVDVTLSPSWLKKSLRSISSPACAATTGPIFRTGEKWLDHYRRKISITPNTMDIPGMLGCMNTAAVLIRTSVLKKIGGFDTSFTRSEDLELTNRILRNGFVISTSLASADVSWDRGIFEYFIVRAFQTGFFTAKSHSLHKMKTKNKINQKQRWSLVCYKLGYSLGKIWFKNLRAYEPKLAARRFFVSNSNLQVTVYEWNPQWEIVKILDQLKLYNRTLGKLLVLKEDFQNVIMCLLENSFSHIEGPHNEDLLKKLIKDKILTVLNIPKVPGYQISNSGVALETSSHR